MVKLNEEGGGHDYLLHEVPVGASLAAGAVPVYLGAPDVARFAPTAALEDSVVLVPLPQAAPSAAEVGAAAAGLAAVLNSLADDEATYGALLWLFGSHPHVRKEVGSLSGLGWGFQSKPRGLPVGGPWDSAWGVLAACRGLSNVS